MSISLSKVKIDTGNTSIEEISNVPGEKSAALMMAECTTDGVVLPEPRHKMNFAMIVVYIFL